VTVAAVACYCVAVLLLSMGAAMVAPALGLMVAGAGVAALTTLFVLEVDE